MKTINSEIPFEELPFHLGLNEDDIVLISSDLKSFALKAKAKKKTINIERFINNFQQVLKNGTIVIPAYTDYLKNGDTFDYQKSKPSTGAISNKTMKRKDFKRTFDPLHSVFVWGKDQNEILQLEDESTFGENSIFGYLQQKNCVFLFFDVHIIDSFTFIHYVEERLNVHYRKYKNWIISVTVDEKIHNKNVKFHTKKPGVINDFNTLNATLLERNLMIRYSYSNIFIDKVTANNASKVATELIQNKKYLYRFSLLFYIKTLIKRIIGK